MPTTRNCSIREALTLAESLDETGLNWSVLRELKTQLRDLLNAENKPAAA